MKIETLYESLPDYYSPQEEEFIRRAYDLALAAHEGQTRLSGAPYINHCVSVAYILSELHVPGVVVAAGLLHDTVEDTHITLMDLERDFGEEVAQLVDGVTKLTSLPRVSRSDKIDDDEDLSGEVVRVRERSRKAALAQETLRKTFLAMGEDIRVVIIKLADRLHNMRTLGYMPEEKQSRIAKQTLEIFAPLASRLGIWQMKWELEDISFRYSNPEKYKEIASLLAERRSERETQVVDIVKMLQGVMGQYQLEAEISGRPKHIYSIYRKMHRKGLPFSMIRDVRAVRILVKDVPTCYSVLGIIHTHWRPIPGEFDDYIAAPKDNFYQSLHTAVIYDDGRTLEVQIRTKEMHNSAEYGIAAHWRYKEGGPRDENYERRVVYLRQLMEWMQEVDDAGEFVDNMKTDVFSDRVYAFTPAGDIIDLPSGSTPIDFAYHVHTEVGHRCRGAKINGKLVSLDYVLQTGDQVEILTAKRGGPSRDWLNANLGLLNTNRARAKARHWFKHQDQELNITSGKAQVDRELKRLSIFEPNMGKLASDLGYKSADEIYLSVGIGDLGLGKLVNELSIDEKDQDRESAKYLESESPIKEKGVTLGDGITILGLKGLLTTLGRCCKPAPGDEIVGYITRGRGATVHRQDCPNILRIQDRERLVKVSWGERIKTYPVAVQIKAYDRDGLVKDVSTVISEQNINMRNVSVSVNKNRALFDLILEVPDISELSRVLTRLESLPNVMEARRIKPG